MSKKRQENKIKILFFFVYFSKSQVELLLVFLSSCCCPLSKRIKYKRTKVKENEHALDAIALIYIKKTRFSIYLT